MMSAPLSAGRRSPRMVSKSLREKYYQKPTGNADNPPPPPPGGALERRKQRRQEQLSASTHGRRVDTTEDFPEPSKMNLFDTSTRTVEDSTASLSSENTSLEDSSYNYTTPTQRTRKHQTRSSDGSTQSPHSLSSRVISYQNRNGTKTFQ